MASTPPQVSDDPFALKDTEKTDEEDVADAARLLQQQIVYNGEVLDISFESMRSYKEGTQSLAYLDASVHLSYALLRMLERWSKRKGGDNMYVRKKAKPKKKGLYSIVVWQCCISADLTTGQGGTSRRARACPTLRRKNRNRRMRTR